MLIIFRSSLLSILVSNENETSKISFESNHEKAYTGIIFGALQRKRNVVVCSEVTDVLVLMVFVYALNNITER